MKITPVILSIPPYISTTWANIHTLYMREKDLVICLSNGNSITIPELPTSILQVIFHAHATFIDNLAKNKFQEPQIQPQQSIPGSEELQTMHFNFDNMESFSSALQHNPAQAQMPSLPPEVLNKIAAIAKVIAGEEIQSIPKPEPHCNCPHCQLARAIHGSIPVTPSETALEQEEIIRDQDLAFQQWEIAKAGDQLYTVINRLDTQEKYNVFLGTPVGCTCGQTGCEHILAVLKS